MPGSPLNPRAEGANQLLRNGASFCTKPEDVLEALAEAVRVAKEGGHGFFGSDVSLADLEAGAGGGAGFKRSLYAVNGRRDRQGRNCDEFLALGGQRQSRSMNLPVGRCPCASGADCPDRTYRAGSAAPKRSKKMISAASLARNFAAAILRRSLHCGTHRPGIDTKSQKISFCPRSFCPRRAVPSLFDQYLPLVIFMAVAALISGALLLAPFLVAHKAPDPEKLSVYECGFNAFDDARMKFDVRFYLVSLLFIIFDLEVAFLFP